jgi:modulator of FtsH protease
MSEPIQTVSYRDIGAHYVDRNRVLRNTYWLLALTLVPTALGAWFGMAAGLTAITHGVVGMVLFLAGAFGFIYAIEKNKNSAAGVPILLGFTFFMGIMMSSLISAVLGFRNGPELVMTAFMGTAGVFFLMASLATVIKRDLSGMSQWLMIGALVILVAGIISIFIPTTTGMLVISSLSMFIFSAYMLYDIKQIIDGGETNYISATLALYLDLVNVFQSLLALLGILGGERD